MRATPIKVLDTQALCFQEEGENVRLTGFLYILTTLANTPTGFPIAFLTEC